MKNINILKKGIYWTFMLCLMGYLASSCLALMNMTNTLLCFGGGIGLVIVILCSIILVKSELNEVLAKKEINKQNNENEENETSK